MKKFNDFDKVNENKTTNPKVWNPVMFNVSESNFIRKQLRTGLKMYQLVDGIMSEINANDDGYPYINKMSAPRGRAFRNGVDITPIPKEYKESLRFKANPFGIIYFLTEDELKEVTPLTDNIREIMELVEQKKKHLIDLIGSTIQNMGKKDLPQ